MDKLPITVTVQRTTGKGRGGQIGIPTINFKIPSSLLIGHGIYAGYLINGNKKYKVAIHFGPRPQFTETDISLEAYILEGAISINSSHLRLEFQTYIRQIRSFPKVDDMLDQIDEDIKRIQTYLVD